MAEAYRGIIKENIEYDFLVPRYGQERMDETVELMLETVLSRRPYIRIAGDDFPRRLSGAGSKDQFRPPGVCF